MRVESLRSSAIVTKSLPLFPLEHTLYHSILSFFPNHFNNFRYTRSLTLTILRMPHIFLKHTISKAFPFPFSCTFIVYVGAVYCDTYHHLLIQRPFYIFRFSLSFHNLPNDPHTFLKDSLLPFPNLYSSLHSAF